MTKHELKTIVEEAVIEYMKNRVDKCSLNRCICARLKPFFLVNGEELPSDIAELAVNRYEEELDDGG